MHHFWLHEPADEMTHNTLENSKLSDDVNYCDCKVLAQKWLKMPPKCHKKQGPEFKQSSSGCSAGAIID